APPPGLLARPVEAPLGRLRLARRAGVDGPSGLASDPAALYRDHAPADRAERAEGPAVPGHDVELSRSPQRLLPDSVRPDPEPARGARGDRDPGPHRDRGAQGRG